MLPPIDLGAELDVHDAEWCQREMHAVFLLLANVLRGERELALEPDVTASTKGHPRPEPASSCRQ